MCWEGSVGGSWSKHISVYTTERTGDQLVSLFSYGFIAISHNFYCSITKLTKKIVTFWSRELQLLRLKLNQKHN